MSKFVFSAFADEIDPSFDVQLASLQKLGIPMLELRGVDGKSFVALSDSEVKAVKDKLDSFGIGLSALGTPLGKIDADGDMKSHLELMNRIMDIGDLLGCRRLRIFSFYRSAEMTETDFEMLVCNNIESMLELSEKRGFTLCHENEKDIFGWDAESEYKLLERFGGRLKAVLDPGNFAFCGSDASLGYPMLKDYVEYFHIKDADENGAIVPPGMGVARLKETLSAVSREREGPITLTMEPHLMIFTGLSGLSKLDDIRHKYSFNSPFEAFEFAYKSTLSMVNEVE